MDSKRIFSFLLVAVICGFIAYNRMSDRDEAAEFSKAQAIALLETVNNYDANRNFYETAGNLAHQRAFQRAFQMGGRRRASEFDPDKYIAVFFEDLIDLAQAEAKQQVVKDLIALRDENGIPRPE